MKGTAMMQNELDIKSLSNSLGMRRDLARLWALIAVARMQAHAIRKRGVSSLSIVLATRDGPAFSQAGADSTRDTAVNLSLFTQ